MDVSSIRLLDDGTRRRESEVTLVAALILLIVLVASLARSCPPLPGTASSSPTPQALSSTLPASPEAPRQLPGTTSAVHLPATEPSPVGA